MTFGDVNEQGYDFRLVMSMDVGNIILVMLMNSVILVIFTNWVNDNW